MDRESKSDRVKRLAKEIKQVAIVSFEDKKGMNASYYDICLRNSKNEVTNEIVETMRGVLPSDAFDRWIKKAYEVTIDIQILSRVAGYNSEQGEAIISEFIDVVEAMERGINPGRKLLPALTLFTQARAGLYSEINELFEEQGVLHKGEGKEIDENIQNILAVQFANAQAVVKKQIQASGESISTKEFIIRVIKELAAYDEKAGGILTNRDELISSLSKTNYDTIQAVSEEANCLNSIVELIEEYHREQGIGQGPTPPGGGS